MALSTCAALSTLPPKSPECTSRAPVRTVDRDAHQAARRDGDHGRALVDHAGVEHQRAVGSALVLADPPQRRRGPDLLLALDPEAHVHRQLAGARELAPHVEQRQEVALVVRGAARVEAAVALGGLERRAVPGVERARRPARRNGRRRARWGRPAGSSAARRSPSGGRRRSSRGRPRPPAPSIRSQTHSAARFSSGGVAPAGGHRGDAKEVVELVTDRRHAWIVPNRSA